MAEGIERDTQDGGRPQRPARPCPDCAELVDDRFCPHCGQRRDLRPLALRNLVWELLIEILDTDARVWRTLRCLVREPGQLTLDWAAGRRMRHVPPFRLYLVLNVLVFLVFSLATRTDLVLDGLAAGDGGAAAFEEGEAELEAELEALQGRTGPGVEGQRRGIERALAAVRTARARTEDAAGEDAVADASGAAGAAEVERPPDFDLTTDPEFRAFLASLGIDQAQAEAAFLDIIENPRAFGERVYDRVPTVMILLLPVLAFALSVLYFFTGRPYVVHLVGLAHLHAFLFLLLLLVEGFDGFGMLLSTLRVPVLPGLLDWAPAVGVLAGLWYLTTWLRRLYGHGRAGAAGMSLVLLTLHLVGVALGVVMVMVLTLLASARG